jgi:Bacteriophage HK97-gp10, putative tail-component
MAELEDFARRIDRIAVRVGGNMERAVKDCAVALARSVISNTPVDSGQARSNWAAELDQAFDGLFPARVPGEKGSTGEANTAATVAAAEEVISRFDIYKNADIHLTNSLPYIRRLNDGHSGQAPSGFVQTAVLDGLSAVRAAKIVES